MKSVTNRPIQLLAAAMGVMAVVAACASHYGKLQYNKDVALAFENFERLGGYEYYYSGRQNKPSAIIGIDRSYEFSSPFWTLIDPDDFQTMVGRLSPPEYGFLNGAFMLTPDGQKAGVWYSWVTIASFRFEGNRIIVNSPEPFADADNGGLGRDPL